MIKQNDVFYNTINGRTYTLICGFSGNAYLVNVKKEVYSSQGWKYEDSQNISESVWGKLTCGNQDFFEKMEKCTCYSCYYLFPYRECHVFESPTTINGQEIIQRLVTCPSCSLSNEVY